MGETKVTVSPADRRTNAVLLHLDNIVLNAHDTVIYAGRKSFRLDDPEAPLSRVAQFIKDEINRVVEYASKEKSE